MVDMFGALITFFGPIAPYVFVAVPIFVLVLLFSIITGRAVSFTVGNKTFSIGKDSTSDGDKVKLAEVKTAINCNECSSKALYIERAKRIVTENTQYINDMRRNLLLQQMNYAEEKLSELRVMICKVYSVKLGEKLGVGVIAAKENKDYKFYRMLVNHIVSAKVKDNVVKKALRENHFLELSKSEFDQYLKRKSDLILDTMSEAFDTYYSDDTIIKRKEVFDLNESIKRETIDIIESIFDNARTISQQYKDLIDAHVKEATEKLDNI